MESPYHPTVFKFIGIVLIKVFTQNYFNFSYTCDYFLILVSKYVFLKSLSLVTKLVEDSYLTLSFRKNKTNLHSLKMLSISPVGI